MKLIKKYHNGHLGENILISFIVLTYKRNNFFKLFLESLKNQTFLSNYELIVLDNGNANCDFYEILKYLDDSKLNYSLYQNIQNFVSPQIFSELHSVASGEYIIFPGDDDILKNDLIENFTKIIKNNNFSMVTFAVEIIDSNNKLLVKRIEPPRYQNKYITLAELIKQNPYFMPATFYSKKAINFLNFPQTITTIDWLLWIQCTIHNNIHVSSKIGIQYRRHASQEQRSYGDNLFEIERNFIRNFLLNNETFLSELKSWDVSSLESFFLHLFDSHHDDYLEKISISSFNLLLATKFFDHLTQNFLAIFYCRTIINSGSLPHLNGLRSYLNEPKINNFPDQIWDESTIGFINKSKNCLVLTKIFGDFHLPKYAKQRKKLILSCECGGSTSHRVKIDYTNNNFKIKENNIINDNFDENIIRMINVYLNSTDNLNLTKTEKKIIMKLKNKYSSKILYKFLNFFKLFK